MTHSYWAVDIAKAAMEERVQQATWGCLRGRHPQTLVCHQMWVKKPEQWSALWKHRPNFQCSSVQACLLWTVLSCQCVRNGHYPINVVLLRRCLQYGISKVQN